jgi:peptidoglycan/xylan/chitin deacetylase (PgdA/CDA1 family)
MFHRIVPDNAHSTGAQISLPVSMLRQKLEFLERHGFTAVTLRDYDLYVRGELFLPARPIILTFDDGYLDTYELAFPLLQEYGMKAVVFVLADRNAKTNSWDSTDISPRVQLMGDKEILELHRAGFEIGSHTLTHADLTALPRDAAWEEISRSRQLLEILLNDRVRAMAYPFGKLTPELKEMVKGAGYAFGCGAWSGPLAFQRDPYEIRRILIHERNGMAGFAMQVLGPYQQYRWALWKAQTFMRRIAPGSGGPPASEYP